MEATKLQIFCLLTLISIWIAGRTNRPVTSEICLHTDAYFTSTAGSKSPFFIFPLWSPLRMPPSLYPPCHPPTPRISEIQWCMKTHLLVWQENPRCLVSVLSFLRDNPEYQVIFFQMCINNRYFWNQNFTKKLQNHLSSYLLANRGKLNSFSYQTFLIFFTYFWESVFSSWYPPISFNGKIEFHYVSGLKLKKSLTSKITWYSVGVFSLLWTTFWCPCNHNNKFLSEMTHSKVWPFLRRLVTILYNIVLIIYRAWL